MIALDSAIHACERVVNACKKIIHFYILHMYHVNVCVHVYEPQSEKMYLSPKKYFFQKSDYTSLNCHLAKFDSNLMTVSG